MWHRPISLLFPRSPHFVGQSDSYKIAMGGLCFPLLMQWRLYNSVLICLPDWPAASPEKPAFHINIHEFIALIINTLFMILSFTNFHRQGSPIPPNIDGWIFLLEADNMFALIQMSRICCIQKYHIVNLCHLLYHILFYFNTMLTSCFDGQCIAVILNVESDTPSCPQYQSTYKQIFQSYPEIASLTDYRVSPTLLSSINDCLLRTLTKATIIDITATLSSRKCNF